MKILTPLTVLFSLFFSTLASAQWDYNQHMVDNMVEHRIDMRKTKARMEAGRKGSTRRGRVSKTGKKARAQVRQVSTAQKKQLSLPSDVVFSRDTFQDFHLGDSNGYRVNFTFTSTTGKILNRSFNFTYYNSRISFKNIPVGKYRVTAHAVYAGRKYPVHLGDDHGESNNAEGGNFGPARNLEVKSGKDQYGAHVLLSSPEELDVRVIGENPKSALSGR